MDALFCQHFFPSSPHQSPSLAGPGQSSSQAKGVSWPLFPNRVSGTGSTGGHSSGDLTAGLLGGVSDWLRLELEPMRALDRTGLGGRVGALGDEGMVR